MPYRKRKSKEAYGIGKQRRLNQLQLTREAKRSADESATSTATMSAPETKEHGDADVEQIQHSSSSSDSDKEVFFICSLDTILPICMKSISRHIRMLT